MTGKKCKYLLIFNIFFIYYSSNNNINQLNQQFIVFFRDFFINVEYTPDKDLTIRFFISLLQMFIENNNNFDKTLINAWENEIKPYILQKFPISKDGLFAVNSDLEFLLNLIDSLKEQYEKNPPVNKDINNNKEEKNKNNEIKNKDSKSDEEEMHNKSVVILRNKKRRGTDHKIQKEKENIPGYTKNLSGNINSEKKEKNKDKDDKIDNNNIEEDIKILRKKNMSRINKFLLEIIKDNIVPPKRTNSMIDLRPHSQTIDSKTTCESSVIEDNTNINLNINKLHQNLEKKSKKDIRENNDSNNNADKNPKQLFGNIFMSGEGISPGSNRKIKGHLRSNSLNLLSEMRPIYKDEEEDEHTIVYKISEKKLTFILSDIFLKKIIFEDFIKNNILLIHHFCQQCFCFVNKEIFFRKIFHCYKYYKDNTPKEKLKNLIDFVNILIIEMFEYYQKINLKDVYVDHIKKFYNDLITDYTKIEDIKKEENKNNNNENVNNDNNVNNLEIKNDNVDNSKNGENDEIKNNHNYDFKKNIINEDLNIDVQNINIFIYKEKEEEKKEIEEDKKKVKTDEDIHMIGKSLTFRAPSLPNANSLFSANKSSLKKFQEDKNDKNRNSSKTVSFKTEKIVLPWKLDEKEEIEEKKEEKEEKKEEKEEKKEEKEENEEKKNVGDAKEEEKSDLVEKDEEKEQKPKFKIAKTLRKSHIIPPRRALKDVIMEVDEDQKEKSDDEENKRNSKALYSDKSESESKSQSQSSSSSSSNSDSDSDNQNEKDKIEISSKSLTLDKKGSKDVREKEEEKEKTEIIKKILEQYNIQEKFISTDEDIMNDIQYIMILLEDGEPSYQDIKEAKNHMKFYKALQNVLNKNKRMAILPSQRQKRYTKSYSSFFSIGLSSKAKDSLSKGYFCTTDWSPEEIGDELMRISKSLLNKIHPRELYRAIFLKKNKEKDSKNVVDCVNRFNRLTSFIIEDILSYNLPKERAKIYERWVAIADYCKTNKDYNDLIAIFSALNNYIITGLNLTLKEVKSKTNSLFRQISDFCTVEGNYKKIREDMNNCDNANIIFIPYLGMLMRDINFFEESSKYINEYGCFNMEKIENIHCIIEKYFRFKIIPEKSSKNPDLKFFEDLEDITEEKLEEIANKIEPDFTIEEIQRPGKRLTSIDEKYFEEYKSQQSNIMSVGTFNRRTVSGFLK